VKRAAAASQPFYSKENDQFVSRIYNMTTKDGRKLAVKFVQGKNETARRLLYREHEFLYSLNSPHFPRPAGFGMDEKTYVLILPFLDGKTLYEAVKNGTLEDGASVAAGLREAADALKAAGIRHRDLRPQNVLLTDSGPVILDFGWACWADEIDCPAPQQLAAPDDEAALATLVGEIAA
jgi:serine/threonine protein kinase